MTLVSKAKTKNKIINPKTSIYLFTVPKAKTYQKLFCYEKRKEIKSNNFKELLA